MNGLRWVVTVWDFFSSTRNTPYRVRVRLSRQRNPDEDAKEEMYTHVSLVPVGSFKGLQTQNVQE